MQLSDSGINFIAKWEGLSLTKYDDGGPGRGNCTVGVGHLIHYGPCDGRASEQTFNQITMEEAFTLFRRDAKKFVDFCNTMFRISPTQNQFDAMVDFSFNTGGGYPQVWNAVNYGGDVCAVLVRTAITPLWAQGALIRRRTEECFLYHNQNQPALPIVVPQEEDVPHTKFVAPFWTLRKLNGRGVANWWVDFPMAVGTIAIDLDVTLVSGQVRFYNGDGTIANHVTPGSPRFVRVYPRPNGTADFEGEGQVAIIALEGVLK